MTNPRAEAISAAKERYNWPQIVSTFVFKIEFLEGLKLEQSLSFFLQFERSSADCGPEFEADLAV